MKTLNQTYLYSKYPKYEEKLFKAVMSYDRIDKSGDAFEELKSEVSKRKTTDNMVKVLLSNNVVLLINGDPLDKALKVFTHADNRVSSEKMKVFIDCSNIISLDNGTYKCSNINIFLAYLFDAMVAFIYCISEDKITNNVSLTKEGANIFAKLFSYIVDFIYKINSMNGARSKCLYMAALYYQTALLEKAVDSESVDRIARDVANISSTEANLIKMDLSEDDFLNIKTFTEVIGKILGVPSLEIDVLVARWMHIFGTGTVFALEVYPSFSSMITDACTDAYINNQNTIEKVVGARDMTDYYKKIIEVCGRM